MVAEARVGFAFVGYDGAEAVVAVAACGDGGVEEEGEGEKDGEGVHVRGGGEGLYECDGLRALRDRGSLGSRR